ncbi:hypothetical protein O0L34_g17701 [Tuta absoluta]|nr:hypothetical protein O0L34_g17701 [Tuta absoluta]
MKTARLIQRLREVDAIVEQHSSPSLRKKLLKMIEDFEKEMAPQVEMLQRDIFNYASKNNETHVKRGGDPKIDDTIKDNIDETDESNPLAQLGRDNFGTFGRHTRLSDYQKGVKIPKLFRITETNNEIILEKADSEEFNKQGLFDFLQNNANVEYNVNDILYRENEKKKIVPYYKIATDKVFDKSLGIFFKPFDRLHKTKKLLLENVRDISRLNSQQDDLNSLRSTFDAKQSKDSIPSLNVYTEEAKHLIQHLREVDAIIGQLNLPFLKRKMLRKFGDFENIMAPPLEKFHGDILKYLSGNNDIHS